jgi:histidine ammonia-lyase
MAAAQGVDFRRLEVGEDAQLGRGTAPIYARIRQEVPFIEKDTVMYKYIAAIKNLISSGALDALIA